MHSYSGISDEKIKLVFGQMSGIRKYQKRTAGNSQWISRAITRSLEKIITNIQSDEYLAIN